MHVETLKFKASSCHSWSLCNRLFCLKLQWTLPQSLKVDSSSPICLCFSMKLNLFRKNVHEYRLYSGTSFVHERGLWLHKIYAVCFFLEAFYNPLKLFFYFLLSNMLTKCFCSFCNVWRKTFFRFSFQFSFILLTAFRFIGSSFTHSPYNPIAKGVKQATRFNQFINTQNDGWEEKL